MLHVAEQFSPQFRQSTAVASGVYLQTFTVAYNQLICNARRGNLLNGIRRRSIRMREVVSTDDAPDAVGPYSQGIITDGQVHTAGQIPFKPDGTPVEGTVADKTRQCFENVSAILQEAGTELTNAISVTVFLSDLDDYEELNEAYAEFFDEEPPVRTTIEAGALPKDVAMEIQAVATIE